MSFTERSEEDTNVFTDEDKQRDQNPFTDSDLKWLKDNIARSDRSKNIGGWFLDFTEWDALLARLEAAERVIAYLNDARLSEVYEDWRKKAGK